MPGDKGIFILRLELEVFWLLVTPIKLTRLRGKLFLLTIQPSFSPGNSQYPFISWQTN